MAENIEIAVHTNNQTSTYGDAELYVGDSQFYNVQDPRYLNKLCFTDKNTSALELLSDSYSFVSFDKCRCVTNETDEIITEQIEWASLTDENKIVWYWSENLYLENIHYLMDKDGNLKTIDDGKIKIDDLSTFKTARGNIVKYGKDFLCTVVDGKIKKIDNIFTIVILEKEGVKVSDDTDCAVVQYYGKNDINHPVFIQLKVPTDIDDDVTTDLTVKFGTVKDLFDYTATQETKESGVKITYYTDIKYKTFERPILPEEIIKSYDVEVNERAEVKDYTQKTSGEYLTRNGHKIILCENSYLMDSYNSGNNWHAETPKDTSKYTYVLYEKIKTEKEDEYIQVPLFSKKLLNEYGIGFILSDWITYNKETNKVQIAWWPERCKQFFKDSAGNIKCKLGTDEETKEKLEQYNQENPLIDDIYTFYNANYKLYNPGLNKQETGKYYIMYLSNHTGSIKNYICYNSAEFIFPGFGNYEVDPDYIQYIDLTLDYKQVVIPKHFILTYANDPGFSLPTTSFQLVALKQVYNNELVSTTIQVSDICVIEDNEIKFFEDTYANRYYTNYPMINTRGLRSTLVDSDYPIEDKWQVKYHNEVDIENITVDKDKETTGQKMVLHTNVRTLVSLNIIVEGEQTSNSIREKRLSDETDWKTPKEYYSQVRTVNNKTTALKYTKTQLTENINDIKEVYFWLDDLHNWCKWVNKDRTSLELYVWNGKNGWDKLTKIISCLTNNHITTLYTKYLYNEHFFNFGPSYDNYSGLHFGKLVYETLVLKENTIYSTYENNTFQNLKLSNFYNKENAQPYWGPVSGYNTDNKPFIDLDTDKTISAKDFSKDPPSTKVTDYKYALCFMYEGHILPTQACPCIVRNATGQLLLCYKFHMASYNTVAEEKLQKPNDNFFGDEETKYLNDVCKMYFGSGDEKTIKDDWKVLNKIKNVIESKNTDIKDITEETIYNKPAIYKDASDNINMKMTITVPRPNIGTESTTNYDYVNRWNK